MKKYILPFVIVISIVAIIIFVMNSLIKKSNHQVTLTWVDQCRGCYYKIYRQTCDKYEIELIANHVTDLKYTDTGMDPGCYDYRVEVCSLLPVYDYCIGSVIRVQVPYINVGVN